MSDQDTELDEFLDTISMSRPRVLKQPKGRLEVIAGPDSGQRVDFAGRARIGTRQFAELVLHDSKVSGVHCEIRIEEHLSVRDLHSKNGTFARGLQVLESLLPSGEVLTLGRSQVRVVGLEQVAEIPLHVEDQFHGLVGHSSVMRALAAQIDQLSTSDATVLILGETGAGKECVAEALRASGRRTSGPLVVLDCSALPPSLIEAQIFGYERGAFTGAVAAHAGVFEQADGGTVFIDEVGELPLDLQPKLLRALEAREVRRIGGTRTIRFDARIIAATHRDLQLEVARGKFREDLYWRLAVVSLHVPPLRQRLEDVPLLAVHLLRQMGIDPSSVLTVDALKDLQLHSWPGNVRELRNALERAIAMGGHLTLDLPDPAPVSSTVDLGEPFRVGKQRLVDDYERAYMTALLAECSGNVSSMAQRASMDRMSIYRILQRLGLARINRK
jgi:DNA-binding NtrC family response regulator